MDEESATEPGAGETMGGIPELCLAKTLSGTVTWKELNVLTVKSRFGRLA